MSALALRSVPASLPRTIRLLATFLTTLLLVGVLTPVSSFAASPTDECSPLTFLGKIDQIDQDEPYEIGDVVSDGVFSITVTAIKDEGEIIAATWSSGTTVVTKVILKAGSAGGPTPYPAGATSGALSSTQGFSHVTFCGGGTAPAAADLTLAKTVTGPAAPAASTVFTFTVACGTDTETVSLKHGESWSWNADGTKDDLVAGTSCSVTETGTNDAAVTATYEGGAYTPATAKTLAAGTTTNHFEFVNHFAGEPVPADLVVTKTVTGNAQPASGTTFDFRVTCGEDVETFALTHGGSWRWSDDAGEGADQLYAGDLCKVEETERRGATSTTATFGGASYVLTTEKALVGGDNTVAVTNTFTRTDDQIVVERDPEPEPEPEPVDLDPRIRLEKSSDAPAYSVGDTITYTYVITNTGDTTLTTVSLTDDVLGNLTDLLETRTLEPGDSVTVTATQEMLPEHVPGLTNTAVASGLSPEGRVQDEATVTVEVSEVEGIVIIHPPVPAPEPQAPVVEPEPAVAPAAQEQLPRTGSDPLLLMVSGLALIGLGSRLLRRQPAR